MAGARGAPRVGCPPAPAAAGTPARPAARPHMKRTPSWGVLAALSSACAFWMTCGAGSGGVGAVERLVAMWESRCRAEQSRAEQQQGSRSQQAPAPSRLDVAPQVAQVSHSVGVQVCRASRGRGRRRAALVGRPARAAEADLLPAPPPCKTNACPEAAREAGPTCACGDPHGAAAAAGVVVHNDAADLAPLAHPRAVACGG